MSTTSRAAELRPRSAGRGYGSKLEVQGGRAVPVKSVGWRLKILARWEVKIPCCWKRCRLAASGGVCGSSFRYRMILVQPRHDDEQHHLTANSGRRRKRITQRELRCCGHCTTRRVRSVQRMRSREREQSSDCRARAAILTWHSGGVHPQPRRHQLCGSKGPDRAVLRHGRTHIGQIVRFRLLKCGLGPGS